MKIARPPFRSGRHEQLMEELREDSYRANAKIADGAACTQCGAAYWKGRWTWRKPAPDGERTVCPACHRIADDYPGGYVTLRGEFLAGHRDEILNLVRARAERAREEHPLQRIMAIADEGGATVITTTDAHLARGIAYAVHEAFKGSLDLRYSKGENRVRATWER